MAVENPKFMREIAPMLDTLLAHDWQIELMGRSDSGQDTIIAARGERWMLEWVVAEGLTDDVSWGDRSTQHHIRLDDQREMLGVVKLSDEALDAFWDGWSARQRKSVLVDDVWRDVPVNG